MSIFLLDLAQMTTKIQDLCLKLYLCASKVTYSDAYSSPEKVCFLLMVKFQNSLKKFLLSILIRLIEL